MSTWSDLQSESLHVPLAGGIREILSRIEDLETAMTPRTKVVLLNTHNNPTGVVNITYPAKMGSAAYSG